MSKKVHSGIGTQGHSASTRYAAMPLCRYAAFAALFLAPSAIACPVCYGAPGPSTTGLNNAIIFLLIIVGLVQAGFVALFWSFRKRAKALQRRREQFRVIEGGV
jgi:hypothetical protein